MEWSSSKNPHFLARLLRIIMYIYMILYPCRQEIKNKTKTLSRTFLSCEGASAECLKESSLLHVFLMTVTSNDLF